MHGFTVVSMHIRACTTRQSMAVSYTHTHTRTATTVPMFVFSTTITTAITTTAVTATTASTSFSLFSLPLPLKLFSLQIPSRYVATIYKVCRLEVLSLFLQDPKPQTRIP